MSESSHSDTTRTLPIHPLIAAETIMQTHPVLSPFIATGIPLPITDPVIHALDCVVPYLIQASTDAVLKTEAIRLKHSVAYEVIPHNPTQISREILDTVKELREQMETMSTRMEEGFRSIDEALLARTRKDDEMEARLENRYRIAQGMEFIPVPSRWNGESKPQNVDNFVTSRTDTKRMQAAVVDAWLQLYHLPRHGNLKYKRECLLQFLTAGVVNDSAF